MGARSNDKRNLTEAFVAKAPGPPLGAPRGARERHWDAKQEGLVLFVYPSGHRTYYFHYRTKKTKKQRWTPIANANSITLDQAREIALGHAFDVAKGGDPLGELQSARTVGSFNDLWKRYIEAKAHTLKSFRQKADFINREVVPRLGKLPAEGIKRSDVQRMFDAITKRGALVAANQTLLHLQSVYSWGIDKEYITMDRNPCKGIEKNSTEFRERILSEIELPLFWAAAEHEGLMSCMALRMILLTGQRPGEVSQMRWEHLDIGEHSFHNPKRGDYKRYGGWWVMPGKPEAKTGWPGTKNGKAHRVWITEEALKLVYEVAPDGKDSGYVFTTTKRRGVAALDRAMRNVAARVGWVTDDMSKEERHKAKVTPHDLRRTHGTLVTTCGHSRYLMDLTQNHARKEIADVYDRNRYLPQLREVQEDVTNRIRTILGFKQDQDNVVPITG